MCVACHVGENLLAESSSTQIAPPPERLPTKVSCLNELLIAAPHQFIPQPAKKRLVVNFDCHLFGGVGLNAAILVVNLRF